MSYKHKPRNLIVAVNDEDHDTVRKLLEEKADPNTRDLFERTPLMRAAVLEESDTRRLIVRCLINHGADINLQDKHKRTALMYICGRDDGIDILKIVLKACTVDYNTQDEEGDTALMYAIRADNHDGLELLLHIGGQSIDVDRENNEGLFPLYLAASQEDTDFCKMLVEGGSRRFHNIPSHLMQYLPDIPKELLREVQNPKSTDRRISLMTKNNWKGSDDSDPVLHGGVSSLRNTLSSILSREVAPMYDQVNTVGAHNPGWASVQSSRSGVPNQDNIMQELARRLAEFELNSVNKSPHRPQSNAPIHVTRSGRVINPNATRDPHFKEIKGIGKGKMDSPGINYSRRRILQRVTNKQKTGQ
ncbi:delta-latroinsectotoxin-Lt1a-like [Anneissia japonica]|uniref:delta-latroinsectotoxin-Lt1a-like n=1 Tax=Anneissia japonica TaxID=1529436 RepID=UPI001425A329|nr:delta-latroinsectotoxin-Lt1a-like [Anneissia japonica]